MTAADLPAALLPMQSLTLSDNEFSGPIPWQWASMTNLQKLVLSNNYLTGAFLTSGQQSAGSSQFFCFRHLLWVLWVLWVYGATPRS
jgi:hypothetical protein